MNFVALDDQLTNVAQIVRKAPKITLRRAYMRAARDWCQQTQWLRMNVPGASVAGTKVYSLGSDSRLDITAIRAMSITDTGGNTRGLGASDSSEWNPNTQDATPCRYCYVPEGEFALDPTPDAVYSLLISIIVVPKETSTQVPADLLVKYSNDIEAGALAYLLAIPGQPWTDGNAAVGYDKAFRASVNNGKAEVQRSYNTGSVAVRRQPFGAGFRR